MFLAFAVLQGKKIEFLYRDPIKYTETDRSSSNRKDYYVVYGTKS